MLTSVPAATLKNPPSPSPDAPMSITPCAVVVIVVPAVRSTSQLPQSPPLATSWLEMLSAPSVASSAIVPPPPCALPRDWMPRLGSPPMLSVPVSDVTLIDPPKPSRFVAFEVRLPFTFRLPTECKLIVPPPKLPLMSIFDLLVPWLCMSIVPVAMSVTVWLPSVPSETMRAPGWRVTFAARIWSSPAPVTVIVLLAPIDSDLGRMS